MQNTPSNDQPFTLIHLAAAIGYAARERGRDIPVLLWAIFQSDQMQALIASQDPPTAERYAEVAMQDEAISYVLGASAEGRMLLTEGFSALKLHHNADALANLQSFARAAGLIDETGRRSEGK